MVRHFPEHKSGMDLQKYKCFRDNTIRIFVWYNDFCSFGCRVHQPKSLVAGEDAGHRRVSNNAIQLSKWYNYCPASKIVG